MNEENKEKVKSNVCLIEDCGRLTHKKSKYCIFHAGAEEKTEEEFKGALKEYIQKIKEEDQDYDFESFIFIGDIDFKKDLSITIFEGANFWNTTFKGGAGFANVTFKKYADFGKTTFEQYADFRNATFERYTHCWGATFKGDAEDAGLFEAIRRAVFRRRNTNFANVIFKKYADFAKATFKGGVCFTNATFEGDTEFWDATFEGDINFDVESFVKGVSFDEISVSSGKKLYLKVENNKVYVFFGRAYLENIYLELDLGAGVLVDFSDAFLGNTQIERDQIENHILQEESKEFSEAKKVYLLLKNNFHSIGQYEDESWAFKKEKDMERKSNCHFKTLHKWLWSCFLNAIYGYGEKPWNVIFSALAIIIIFALLFSVTGIGNPEIIELKGTAIHQNSGNIVDLASKGFLKNSTVRNFPDSLYFSLITFTTLGYGDFRPLEGWGRILAGSEAFIGAFMMALFVYTFARRTGGR